MNGDGATVLLYQPILYGPKPLQEESGSHIGGVSGHDNDIQHSCSICHRPLFLLVQLSVSGGNDSNSTNRPCPRTLQVFACNRAACFHELFQDGPLCYGGKGCVKVCCRLLPKDTALGAKQPAETEGNEILQSDHAWDDKKDDASNEWDVDESVSGKEMHALEQKLSALETMEATTEAKTNNSETKKVSLENKKSAGTERQSAFQMYAIHAIREPMALKSFGGARGDDDDDDDDVGMATNDDRIQNMLARYLAEEDDPEILSALQGIRPNNGGINSSNSSSKFKSREKDERLSAKDRAMLTYTDRLKRSPRQVLRYAFKGTPLWSM